MKNYAAMIAAALIVIYAAGCTAVNRFEVDDADQAYTRVLYPDGEYPEESEEELEEDFEYEYEDGEEEEAEEEIPSEQSKPESKKEVGSETKSEKKESAASSKKQAQSSVKSSLSNTSSKKKSASHTTYRLSDLKKNSSNSSNTSSGSALSSDTDSEKPEKEETPKPGSFREIDLSYNAKKDYLDFDDSEEFVLETMGEPSGEFYGEDEKEKEIVYKDCIITLRQRGEDGFRLVRILVPSDSFYRTMKGIETETRAESVIEAYGDPTNIQKFYPDGIVPEDEPFQPEESEPQQTDTQASDVSDEEISGTDQADSGETDTDPVVLYELYEYSIDDRALIFRIEEGRVAEIEYRWSVDF